MSIMRKVIYIVLVATAGLIIFATAVKAATQLEVTADTLNLRKEASTDSDILTLLSKGEKCELVEEAGDWYKIKYKTYTGYVTKEYVKEEKDTSTNEKTNSTDVENNVDNNNLVEQNNDNQPSIDDSSTKIGQISKKTEVKILPLINSSVIESLNKDAKVTVITEINGWAYIQTDSATGWIRSNAITAQKVATNKTDNEDDNKVSENNTNSNSQNEPDNKNSSENYEEKTMYVNDSYVNLRKEPNTSCDIIMVVELNTKLTVIGESGDWYKVNTSNGEAYISKELLSEQQTTTSRSGATRIVQNSSDNVEQTTKTTEASKTTSSSSDLTKGNEIVTYAKKFLDVPYVYGGASPSGFDCSGFTMYVYKHFGISMGHGAQMQSRLGKAVNADKSSASSLKQNLQPGDLVFFLDYETMDEIGHCGIYVGNGNFIHASSGSGYCVKINSLLPGEYYNTRYCAARRVI